QRTLERWEDKHVRLLIESYLQFKGLIGQANTKKSVFDKIAAEFNKHADIKVSGEQCLRNKQEEHIKLGNSTRKWSSALVIKQVSDQFSHLIQVPAHPQAIVHNHLKQLMTSLTQKMQEKQLLTQSWAKGE
ncbi:unnamed protein product, partial [Porites evermanni]